MKKFCLILLVSCTFNCFAQTVDLEECHRLISESQYYSAEKILAEKLKSETDPENLETLISEYSKLLNTINTASENYNHDFFTPLLKEGEKLLTDSKVYDFFIGDFQTETDEDGNRNYYLTIDVVPSEDLIGFTEDIIIPYKNSFNWYENPAWPEFSDFYAAKNEIDSALYIAEENGRFKNSAISFIKVPEATKEETITFYKIQFTILAADGSILYKSPKELVRRNGKILLSGLTEKNAQKIASGNVQYQLKGVWILTGDVPQIDFGLGKSVKECVDEINSHGSGKTLDEMDAFEALKEISSGLSEFSALQKQIDSFDWNKWSTGLKETPLDANKYRLFTSREEINDREKEFTEETKAIVKNINEARTQKIKDEIVTDKVADVAFEMVPVTEKEFTVTEWRYGRENVYSAEVSSFLIGRMEVTEELFEKVTEKSNDKVTNKKIPAVMSWNDAVAFCNLLSVQAGLQPCYSVDGIKDVSQWNYQIGEEADLHGAVTCDFYADGYRLPTEAEWSLAANYGNSNGYEYAGSSAGSLCGWVKDTTNCLMEGGQKLCNDLGLFDMTGNAIELCFDSYVYFSEWNFGKQPLVNPVIQTENGEAVVRGGSYLDKNRFDERSDISKSLTYFSTTGLRLVRSTASQLQERKQADDEYNQKLAEKDSADGSKLDDFVHNGFVQIPDSCYYEGTYYLHRKTLPGFRMWKTEVTQEIYTYVTGIVPDDVKEEGFRENYPVFDVKWNEAAAFCNLLSIKYGLEPCFSYEGRTDPADWPKSPSLEKFECDFSKNGFRLPTVMEWEAAAKSAETDTDYKYASTDNIDAIAWFSKNSGDMLHEVATKEPSPLGIYDLCGNIQEWCWDTISSFGSKYKAIKGGCFDLSEYFCEWSHTDLSGYSSRRTGFRIVQNCGDIQ